MAAAGLDFGTSNTTLGVVAGGRADMVRLEGGEETLPSATFYHQGGSISIGRAAVAAYVGGEHGRLMRALKSVLGSALIDETTLVGKSRVKFRDVLKRYLAEVKARGEAVGLRVAVDEMHRPAVHEMGERLAG